MQFKASTDYGLRTVLYLATKNDTCSSKDIAKDMSIPRDYLIQLAQLLRNAGIIEARPGKNGGYKLARDVEDISLLEIIDALDEESGSPSQVRRENRAHAKIDKEVRPVYQLAIDSYEEYFGKLTIAELMNKAQSA